jgi:hypothetical protein
MYFIVANEVLFLTFAETMTISFIHKNGVDKISLIVAIGMIEEVWPGGGWGFGN